VTLRAGLTAMRLMTDAEHTRINALGDRLRDGLREQGRQVAGLGSLVKIHDGLSDGAWWNLYNQGVLIARHGLACISTPMTEETVDEALAMFARAGC
jgi:glutamate-1-semialdehyde 2,1-aminomutase